MLTMFISRIGRWEAISEVWAGGSKILAQARVALRRHWLNSLEPFDRTNQNCKTLKMAIDKLWIVYRLGVWLISEKRALGEREQKQCI